MAETPLISIFSLGQIQATTTGTPTQNATNAPSLLPPLPSGTILSGFIISRDNKGNPILKTDKGSIVLHSDVFIRTGSEVVIRLETIGTDIKARILSIDGQQPLKAAAPQEESVILSEPLLTSGRTLATKDVILPSNFSSTRPTEIEGIFTAVSPLLNKIASKLPEALRPQQPIIPGTILTVRLIATELPAVESLLSPTATPNASTEPTNAEARLLYSAYAKQASQPTPQNFPPTPANATPLPEDNATTLKPLPAQQAGAPTTQSAQQPTTPATPVVASNITRPTATSPAPSPPSAVEHASRAPASPPTPAASLQKGQVEGVVIGKEKSGMAVVHTAIGTIKLNLPGDLPSGTRVLLEIANFSPLAAGTPELAASELSGSPSMLALTKSWPSLAEAVSIIARHDMQAAQQIIEKSIPQISSRFAAGIIFFISALKGGSVRDWLGSRGTEILENTGNDALLSKLGGEFSILRSGLEQPPNQQWQTLVFPFMHGEEWHQARMFIKKDQSGNKGKDAQQGTRFIVEVENKTFGELQLDGLVQQRAKKVQFDLMIRSHHAFPASMQNDISDIFNSAAELTGFQGQIQFQTVKQFPIRPIEEALPTSNNSIYG